MLLLNVSIANVVKPNHKTAFMCDASGKFCKFTVKHQSCQVIHCHDRAQSIGDDLLLMVMFCFVTALVRAEQSVNSMELIKCLAKTYFCQSCKVTTTSLL